MKLSAVCEQPFTLPSPPLGERVAQGWRGRAEPYPELGEGGRRTLGGSRASHPVSCYFATGLADPQRMKPDIVAPAKAGVQGPVTEPMAPGFPLPAGMTASVSF